MEIYNIISRFKNHKTVVLGGLVASIATYISTAFNKVIATESSVFMIHNAQDWAMGDYKEIKKVAERVEKANDQIANILSKRSGKTVDEIKTLMDAETWLYGQEIVDAGFADELVQSKDTAENSLHKDIAIEQAKNEMKIKIAAVYKKKSEINTDNSIENNLNGEESMATKKEVLDAIKTFKENGEITLSDIADSIGLKDQVITPEHISALKLANEFKTMKIENPISYVKNLHDKQEKDAESVRNAKLAEVFGPSNVVDGKEKNLVFAYAKNQVKDATGDDLNKAIEDLKEDDIAKRLMEDKADPNSAVNQIGIIENKDGDNPEDKSGLQTVIL